MRIDTWSAINVGDYLSTTYPKVKKNWAGNSTFKKIAFFHEFPLLMRRRCSRVTSVQNGPIRVNPAFTWPIQFGAGLAFLVNWPGLTWIRLVSPGMTRFPRIFHVNSGHSGSNRAIPGHSGSSRVNPGPDFARPFGSFRIKPGHSGSNRLNPGMAGSDPAFTLSPDKGGKENFTVNKKINEHRKLGGNQLLFCIVLYLLV